MVEQNLVFLRRGEFKSFTGLSLFLAFIFLISLSFVSAIPAQCDSNLPGGQNCIDSGSTSINNSYVTNNNQYVTNQANGSIGEIQYSNGSGGFSSSSNLIYSPTSNQLNLSKASTTDTGIFNLIVNSVTKFDVDGNGRVGIGAEHSVSPDYQAWIYGRNTADTALAVSAWDDNSYIAKFFNKEYSLSTPIMSLFAYSSGAESGDAELSFADDALISTPGTLGLTNQNLKVNQTLGALSATGFDWYNGAFQIYDTGVGDSIIDTSGTLSLISGDGIYLQSSGVTSDNNITAPNLCYSDGTNCTGGSQTPWTSNIDGNGYNLTNVSSIFGTRANFSSSSFYCQAIYPGDEPWYCADFFTNEGDCNQVIGCTWNNPSCTGTFTSPSQNATSCQYLQDNWATSTVTTIFDGFLNADTINSTQVQITNPNIGQTGLTVSATGSGGDSAYSSIEWKSYSGISLGMLTQGYTPDVNAWGALHIKGSRNLDGGIIGESDFIDRDIGFGDKRAFLTMAYYNNGNYQYDWLARNTVSGSYVNMLTFGNNASNPYVVVGGAQFANVDDGSNSTFRVVGNTKTSGNAQVNGMIKIGGTTSAYPSIKRNGSSLDIRLADDSSYASIQTANLSAIGNINQTSGNATINEFYGNAYTQSATGVGGITLNATYQAVNFSTLGLSNGFKLVNSNKYLTLDNPSGAGTYEVFWRADKDITVNHALIGYIYINETQYNETFDRGVASASGDIHLDGFGHIKINYGDNVSLRIADTSGTTSTTVYLKDIMLRRVSS